MTDHAKELRERAERLGTHITTTATDPSVNWDIHTAGRAMLEAADEIERLRRENEALQHLVDTT